MQELSAQDISQNRELLPQLKKMENSHPRQAEIVHRYLFDMNKGLDAIKSCLKKDGVVVMVCGDNLVGGYSIPTWKLLNQLLEERGFILFDRFGDYIDCRNVPPKRNGHKGLIKQEVISAFLNSKG